MIRSRRGARVALLAVVSLGAASLLTAGAMADSQRGVVSTDGVATAKALVAKARAPQLWKQPGPAFDATKAKGKTVFYISLSLSIPFQQNILKGVQDAMAATGNKTVAFDGKAQVSEYARGIEQAISQKADAIIIAGISSTQLAAPINDAGKAGIPVITEQTHDPGPPAANEPKAVKAEATHCFSCAGRLMADYLTADSGGKAKAMVIWSSDISFIGEPQLAGIKSEAAKLCPKCELLIKDVRVANWATGIPTLVQSIVRSDPKVNYIMPLYDGMALFVVPAIHQANGQNRVKVITFNATPGVMEFVKRKDVVVADVGSAAQSQGWGIADDVLRVWTGHAPAKDIFVPERTFDSQNIGQIDLKAQESSWYGDPAWKSKYLALWGVKK